jgi:hypothetical protein
VGLRVLIGVLSYPIFANSGVMAHRVLPAGFEPATNRLGGDYSSSELREHTNAGEGFQTLAHIDQSRLPPFLVPADRLGKGNRNVLVTLEGFEPSFNRLEGDRVSPTLQSECGFNCSRPQTALQLS